MAAPKKRTPTPIDKLTIDRVTIENLDMALRLCNIHLSPDVIDNVIDVIELIEENGYNVSLMDICKLQEE